MHLRLVKKFQVNLSLLVITNDTVPKTLDAGGVVIPNSVMQSDSPSNNAHKFVTAILAKQNMNRRK